ncbi:hypothetical protein [Synechococcus sp. WH 8016]|jgi:hypothetical protein|uniref:hypothetical protein n=1 Tax=Synechococcus sp. WH 8016 TaxID=166318 RepID=UPI00022D8CA1|nr:hypothetical protein [Synechococcus sp. WH 8016]EHA59358.1 hypothetical protein Syn8016DRAFT_2728 [Synechococcus sp. WH 8016]
MPAIQDHDYLRLCAELATELGISQSSARRRVELAASKIGAKDLMSRKEVATTLLADAQNERSQGDHDQGQVLDRLLEAEPLDEKFMLED